MKSNAKRQAFKFTRYIQNCPQEETCYEFYKSSKAHPVLLVVFLESLGPEDHKNIESK